jgi:hypothetical protein
LNELQTVEWIRMVSVEEDDARKLKAAVELPREGGSRPSAGVPPLLFVTGTRRRIHTKPAQKLAAEWPSGLARANTNPFRCRVSGLDSTGSEV